MHACRVKGEGTCGAGMSANLPTHVYMCSVNHTHTHTHIIHGRLEETHTCQRTLPFLPLLLPLSLGSPRSACAPNPQKGGGRTLQRWSGHLDFSPEAAVEGLGSPWIPWPREGADAQNTTLLCYTQSTGQSKGKGQQIVARDPLVSHQYFLSKDDLKTLDVNPWVMDHVLMQSIELQPNVRHKNSSVLKALHH